MIIDAISLYGSQLLEQGSESLPAVSSKAVAPTVVNATRTGADGTTDQGSSTSTQQAPDGCSAQRAGANPPPGTTTSGAISGVGMPLRDSLSWYSGSHQQPSRQNHCQ